MAIKNTKLGGTDWSTPSARIKPTDLNDTMDVLGDVVNKSLGSIWNDTAQNLFNTAYIGFDSNLNYTGSPALKNVKYTLSGNFSDDTQTNSYFTSQETNLYGPFEEFDFFDDEGLSISGNNTTTDHTWTATTSKGEHGTALISEHSDGYIRVHVGQGDWPGSPTATIISDQTTLDLNQSCTLLMDVDSISVSAGSANDAYDTGEVTIYLNDVIIAQRKTSGPGGGGANTLSSGLFRIEINPGSDEVSVYTADDILDTDSPRTVDISSLNNSNQWFIKIRANCKNHYASASININYIKLLENKSVTSEWESELETTSETVTNAIPIFNLESEDNVTTTYYLTADGTNYEEVTNGELHRFTNTGSSLGAKVTFNSSNGINIARITEYAIKYNLY